MNTSVTGNDGVVEFQSTIPSDASGYYDVLILAPDDLTDS